jgi:hypothetical protein
VTASAYRSVITAPAADRLGLFLAAAQRLGAPLGNIEKDFWVCWTLDALYHHLPAGGPRLLFWLHRIEGDVANAGYWCRRAHRDAAEGDPREEGETIAAFLLKR